MRGPDFWKNFSAYGILLSLRMEKKYRLHLDDPDHWTVQQINEIALGYLLYV